MVSQTPGIIIIRFMAKPGEIIHSSQNFQATKSTIINQMLDTANKEMKVNTAKHNEYKAVNIEVYYYNPI